MAEALDAGIMNSDAFEIMLSRDAGAAESDDPPIIYLVLSGNTHPWDVSLTAVPEPGMFSFVSER
jgi:hypothetical protein